MQTRKTKPNISSTFPYNHTHHSTIKTQFRTTTQSYISKAFENHSFSYLETENETARRKP